jgi:hypothetical protein
MSPEAAEELRELRAWHRHAATTLDLAIGVLLDLARRIKALEDRRSGLTVPTVSGPPS